jgi:hypothetical protein
VTLQALKILSPSHCISQGPRPQNPPRTSRCLSWTRARKHGIPPFPPETVPPQLRQTILTRVLGQYPLARSSSTQAPSRRPPEPFRKLLRGLILNIQKCHLRILLRESFDDRLAYAAGATGYDDDTIAEARIRSKSINFFPVAISLVAPFLVQFARDRGLTAANQTLEISALRGLHHLLCVKGVLSTFSHRTSAVTRK